MNNNRFGLRTPFAAALIATILAVGSPCAALDLEATDLEVTQANQDLDNTIRLVAKKNTWVRVHAHAVGADQVDGVVARLSVRRIAPGPITLLGTIDSPPTDIRDNPNRYITAHAFNIQVPYAWRSGTIELTATVDFADDVDESNEQNNSRAATVSFETVPPIRLRAFGVEFPGGDLPAQIHYDHITSWLRRAYPTSALLFEQTTLTTITDWPNDECACIKDSDGNCLNNSIGLCSNVPGRKCDSDIDCGCGYLNEMLMQRRAIDENQDPDLPPDLRYVALVDDATGFMRGCSPGADEKVAAGPVGTDTWGWDSDGSYADWYTGHELGHAYGRPHAVCCGAKGNASYPYPDCEIGDDDQAGFDSGGPRAFSYHAKDVMSYCSGIWMSDFTFEAIMDQLIEEDGAPPPPYNFVNDLAIVAGNANLSLGQAHITGVHRLPGGRVRLAGGGGDWELRFLDASGATLSTHAFTPSEVEDDHDLVPPSIGQDGFDKHRVALFAETVAVPAGPITRLGLFHLGVEIDSRSASANPPTVTITSPNGGENIDRTTTVEWSAADLDDDDLRFTVLYSADAGDNWHMLAGDIAANLLAVDLAGLPGGDQGLFRVMASDGFYSASDDSDARFTVANGLPQVYITDPVDGSEIAIGQTAMFEGLAQDAEDGDLDGDSLVWSSDRQGTLGTGAHLAIGAELVPGTHVITLTAYDSQGESSTAAVTILKGSTDADACPAYPRTDCDSSAGTSLNLKDRGGRRRLAFRFPHGSVERDATTFGSPLTTTTHTLCLFEAGRLRDAIAVAPSASDWTAISARGFHYANRLSGGVIAGSLRAGSPARPAAVRVSLRGAGAELPALPQPLQLPVAAQLMNDTTPTCFGAEFPGAAVRQNEKGSFQAR